MSVHSPLRRSVRRITRRGSRTLLITGALLATAVVGAHADSVKNNAVKDVDGTVHVTAGTSVGIGFKIDAEPFVHDGEAQCNATAASPATLNFSGLPAGATPTSISIDDCNGFDVATFAIPAGTQANDYVVSVSVSDSGPGAYTTSQAGFTLRIAAVSNPDTDADGVANATDNCPNVANAGQENNDGDAEGDACDGDDDNDSVADVSDNCRFAANTDQADLDGDGRGDVCDADDDGDTIADTTDNCPSVANTGQTDTDGDGAGDACDADDDNDTVTDESDNCALVANAGQENNDGDAEGDVCDADDDNDTVNDDSDNCQFAANTGQENNDGDAEGDVCDADDDNDTVADDSDNCQFAANTGQENNDGDAEGDVCDADDDNDAVNDDSDNCQFVGNAGQENNDGDAEGDVCDADDDNDTVADETDNCQFAANSGQENNDGDAEGDVCDADDDNDTVNDDSDNCQFAANSGQENNDGDAEGDVCDADDDNDTVNDDSDNCQFAANTGQENNDGDALGDACDPNSYAPAAGSLSDAGATGFEGSSLNATGAFTDRDGNGTVTITKVSGAGTVTQGTDGAWSWSHSASDDASGTVVVSASDGEHADATQQFDWTAANVAPYGGAAAFDTTSLTCGQAGSAKLNFSFVDPGADTWSALIDWDYDGTFAADQTVAGVGKSGSVTHAYSTAGVHRAAVRLQDDDGGVSSSAAGELKVLYRTSGILQPINLTTPRSAFKLGSTIPVKIQVFDCDGTTPVSTLAPEVRIVRKDATPDGTDLEPTSTASPTTGTTMRYDATGKQYIYNLGTKSMSVGDWYVRVVDAGIEGAPIEALISLRK